MRHQEKAPLLHYFGSVQPPAWSTDTRLRRQRMSNKIATICKMIIIATLLFFASYGLIAFVADYG